MRNTTIIILLAIFIIAVIYTVTNTTPSPPQLPPPLALTKPYMPFPLTLPPYVSDNFTNAPFLDNGTR